MTVGVLCLLSLVGLSFVLMARTESATAASYRVAADAELLVHGELALVRAALIADLYPEEAPITQTRWRLYGESRDYPDSADGWLFGMTGDGTAVLQTSFGGTQTPQADNDTRDTPDRLDDSVWRTVRLADGHLARVSTLVLDHGGLANLNVWGNIQGPAGETHNAHQGLHPHELCLSRVLWPEAMTDDQRATYRALFVGRETLPESFAGRYGYATASADVGPGLLGIDDDQDAGDAGGIALPCADDDADDTIDETDEGVDEPDEYCPSNPGGAGLDADRPFDSVDLWELLHDLPFSSRLEALLDGFDLDRPFASGTGLGTVRRNLTTLSADGEWVGAGAADTADRLRLRVDLNHASLTDVETAFRQAGLAPLQARQLAVNLIDARDPDDDVTAHPHDPTVLGHERQPFINEVYFVTWRPPGWGPPPGHGPPDGSGWNQRVAVAVELYNPYDTPINIYQWELRIDVEGDSPDCQTLLIDDGPADTNIPPNGYVTLISFDNETERGGFQIHVDGKTIILGDADFLLWPVDDHVYRIRLVRARRIGQRPGDATGQLVVDDTAGEIDFNVLELPAVSMPGHPGHGGDPGPPPDGEWRGLDLFRRDAEVNRFERGGDEHPTPTLGSWNVWAERDTRPPRYGVPIPNAGARSFAGAADLGQVLDYSQNGDRPYTDDYAAMTATTKERGIKFDLSGDWYAGGPDNANRRVLDLVCVNRPDHDGLDNDADGTVDEADEADWPVYGRLNINTASQVMLERALWCGPYPTDEAREKASVLANEIVKHRETVAPFNHIGDLFASPDLAAAMAYWAIDGADNDGDGVGGEGGEQGEKDERDARFRCLANLLTTRSNVFTVFVTVEVYRDTNRSGAIEPARDERLASRKAIAVLDRSRARMAFRRDGEACVRYVESGVAEVAFRWISD